MKLEYLKYLIDIAATKSINFSAERFYITQQSMSRAIKALEEELDVKLLQRSYTGVSLTPAGKVLVERGQQIVNIMQEINEDLKNLNQENPNSLFGEICIRVNYQVMSSVISSLAQLMSLQYPHVHMIVESESAYQVTKAVYEGIADIGIVGISSETLSKPADYKKMFDELHVIELYTDEMLVCLNKNFYLSQKTSISPEELLHFPQINYSFQPPINEVLFPDKEPQQALSTNNNELFKKSIQQGLGWGFTNTLDVHFNYSKIEKQYMKFLPLNHPSNTLTFYLLQKPDHADSIVEMFSEICVSFFKELPDSFPSN